MWRPVGPHAVGEALAAGPQLAVSAGAVGEIDIDAAEALATGAMLADSGEQEGAYGNVEQSGELLGGEGVRGLADQAPDSVGEGAVTGEVGVTDGEEAEAVEAGRVSAGVEASAPEWDGYAGLYGRKQAIHIERERHKVKTGETSKEVSYALTSLGAEEASPEQLAALVRSHWHIDNRLHFVRDFNYDEDRCRVYLRDSHTQSGVPDQHGNLHHPLPAPVPLRAGGQPPFR